MNQLRLVPRNLTLSACLAAHLIAWAVAPAQAATYLVSNTLDSGPGSLRQAIIDANNTTGFDQILFNIPGSGIKNIKPESALPAIRDRVLIDGTSQPSPNTLPSVQLNGKLAGALVDGLTIEADECEVRGMIINRFGGAGILIQDSCCSIIAGNFIGTANGRDDFGNGGDGVHILASTDNVIGGYLPNDRNVISGNTANGIRIENGADRNIVVGNFIGVDVTGTNRLGNVQRGVSIQNARFNQIGGELPGSRNVISGNAGSGVAMVNGASRNVVQGNFIGTDVSGTKAIPSGSESQGVRIFDAGSTDNLIGGTTLAARNIISGNSLSGVTIDDGASYNRVHGNFIGTDLTGTLPVPNGSRGVSIKKASNNSIGGTEAGAGNTLAFNTSEGVFISGNNVNALGNSILGNKIFSNGELGIDLVGTDGVTLNDSGDADGGANRQQNYPVLTLASNTTSGLLIKGNLNTIPSSATIIVELFASDVCDPSGYGEGKVFLTRTNVSTDASGNASFSVTLPATAPAGHFVTATATLDKNTSEFSRCLTITEFRPTLTLRPLGEGRASLEWADHTGQFVLEFSDSLSPAHWRPVTERSLVSNGVSTLSIDIITGQRYFRLARHEGNGRWTVTSPMNTARYSHTMTLLPNGKVLVAGGVNDDLAPYIFFNAELYDSATATWVATGALRDARYAHTATLLPNGHVLVVGGLNGTDDFSSVELYDPSVGTWRAAGPLIAARYSHTATMLPNGKVLVVGGFNFSSDELASTELYDSVDGTWTLSGSLATRRYGHTATLLPNRQVLVAGGIGYVGELAGAELYDPITGTWTATGALITERYRHTATLLPNGQVLVSGGDSNNVPLASAELYDLASGTWTATSALASARFLHTATLLADGKVLITGGNINTSGTLSSSELYDSISGIWTTTGALVRARGQHTADLLPNGKVLVAGGFGSGVLSSVELYDAGLDFGLGD